MFVFPYVLAKPIHKLEEFKKKNGLNYPSSYAILNNL